MQVVSIGRVCLSVILPGLREGLDDLLYARGDLPPLRPVESGPRIKPRKLVGPLVAKVHQEVVDGGEDVLLDVLSLPHPLLCPYREEPDESRDNGADNGANDEIGETVGQLLPPEGVSHPIGNDFVDRLGHREDELGLGDARLDGGVFGQVLLDNPGQLVDALVVLWAGLESQFFSNLLDDVFLGSIHVGVEEESAILLEKAAEMSGGGDVRQRFLDGLFETRLCGFQTLMCNLSELIQFPF